MLSWAPIAAALAAASTVADTFSGIAVVIEEAVGLATLMDIVLISVCLNTWQVQVSSSPVSIWQTYSMECLRIS